MGEYLQCPNCLKWLNLEKEECKILYARNIKAPGRYIKDIVFCKDKIYYHCNECDAIFSEDGEVIVEASII